MKLRISGLRSLHGVTFCLFGIMGFSAYAYFLAVPWYWRVIDNHRWSVIARERREMGLSPTMPSMESMVPVAAPAGKHHKPLQMVLDTPGVTQPKFTEARSSKLTNDGEVFGIVVNGKPYAFARAALLEKDEHIVNLRVSSTPVSVTYCSFRDCVRVLTRDGGARPIDLRVGGLDVGHQMVFLLDGVRYGQSSADLPLEDFPFERMTYGEWKELHPETLVYGG